MSGSKTEDALQREKDYNRNYYQDNRDEILLKRKQKYQNDPEYRARMQARDQRNYWFKDRAQTPEKELPDVRFREVPPKGHIEVTVRNPTDARDGKIITVAVYGTAELGEFLDRDPQTLRKWLKAGVIPEPATRGEDLPEGHALRRGRSPRLYTEDEARAIYESRDLLARPYGRIKDSLFAQSVREELEDLVQGLKVVPKMGGKTTSRQRLVGTCENCGKPFVGRGDQDEAHVCRKCGGPIALEDG